VEDALIAASETEGPVGKELLMVLVLERGNPLKTPKPVEQVLMTRFLNATP
jgi:hypothetical protein